MKTLGNITSEREKQLEYLIFGHVINSLNLAESLYILNESNYKNHLNNSEKNLLK